MPNITDTVTTADGSCTVRLFTPAGPGPWPGVVMFPDAGGARETFYQMAAKLAEFGYAVLLPDVYYRNGDWAPFDMASVFGDETELGQDHGQVRRGDLLGVQGRGPVQQVAQISLRMVETALPSGGEGEHDHGEDLSRPVALLNGQPQGGRTQRLPDRELLALPQPASHRHPHGAALSTTGLTDGRFTA